MAKKNTVLGPLVVANDEGGSAHYFYKGAVLPAFVKGDVLKGLVDSGLVGSEDDLAEAEAAEQDPSQAPAEKAAAARKSS